MRSVSVYFITLVVFVVAVGAVPLVAADPAGLSDDPAALSTDPAFQTDESDAAFPVTLTDATGTELTLDERPERVTTTNPSAAQVMWELGADDQVVGLTQFAHYLDGAESRENVSSTEQGVSIERVVGTEPDLVLAPNATSVETVETLRETGLTVYHFPEATDFDDVADKTLTIGLLTGNEGPAHETNAWMRHNVETIEAITADAETPTVLYPLLGGFAVGDETFINEIIVASGGKNVAADEFDGYQVLNDETVLTLDPEVLIVTDQTEGQLIDSEPYSLTKAGQTQRVASLEVNYLNQPAPRSVVYATRNLTAQLHIESVDSATSVDDDSTADSTSVSTPGFGSVIAVVAVAALALLARRVD